MKITEISIKRPTLVVVSLLIITILGVLSYTSLNYELLPKFASSFITVSTVYPGASPSEVENTVTKKLEDALASIENIKKIKSTSLEGVSIIQIELREGANADVALQDGQRKINAILADLPEDVKTPSLNKFSFDDLPIITIAASGKMEPRAFYDLMDQRVAPALSRIEGVAQVNLIGGQEREIKINIDRTKLEGYKLSILQVQQAISIPNLDFPTGKIKTNEQQVLLRLSGKYQSLDELKQLVLKTGADGSVVRVGDIAEVEDGQKDVEKIARVDQKNAISVQIIKQSDANAVQVSAGVKKEIKALESDYQNIQMQLQIANDSSDYTLESANAVIFDLALAVVLVAFVMLFFLHSLRNAFIVMVSIPASLIATFIGIKLFGFSLNLMSLLGLSLVVGILVDDAIVVLENIYRHMEMGKNRVRAAYDGVSEIGFTVVSITLVIVVVFLPISLSTGLVSNILRQFCVVVMIATMLSLVASFTIVPWLSSRFGKLEHINNRTFFGRILLGFEKMIDNFTHWISGILRWSLNHKTITLAATLVLLFGSFALVGMGFIGGEFIPAGDRGEFIVQVELPKDASVEQTNLTTRKIEGFLAQKTEVRSLITTVAQTSEGFGSTQTIPYKSEITVKLVDRKERIDPSDVYAAKVKREIMAQFPEVKVKTTPVSILGTANNAPIELIVTGSQLDSVMAFAETAKKVLGTIKGATEIKLSVEAGNPEIIVQVDRDKMASLGLNLQQVGGTMQMAFNGNDNAKFRQGEYEYDINVKIDDFNKQNIEDVKALSFLNNQGQLIRLDQFASVRYGSGPSQLERTDKATSVNVLAQVIGVPSGTVATQLEQKLATTPRPQGISYRFGGDVERQGDSFGTLGVALIISIVIVYLILVALYDNYVYPLVVLVSIPLSIIGALAALALSNSTLNIFTILGIIMLIGLVAKNAILLVDFTNQMKKEGQSTTDALINANHARLRPILMTTIAMVIGMMPIALAGGAGAEWKNGLAWAIIGGLLSSMFLTLIVVPVVYKIVDSILQRLQRNKKTDSIDALMVADYQAIDVQAEKPVLQD